MTSLRGNLNAVDLANVFQMLSMNQREGTLYIFDGRTRKAIYFGHEGVSMLTRGRHRPNALGRILLRRDRLSPEQLQDALRDQREDEGRMLGQVLVERGLVTRADVEEALRIQIEEEVYSLFIWKDAQFEFVEGPPEPGFTANDGVNRLTFSVNGLIMEASKRVDEWAWIQRVVPSPEEVYRYTGGNLELADDVFDTPWAGKVLASIDGRRSLEEIEQASYVNRFEVHKMVALLSEGGAVETLPAETLLAEATAAAAAGAHEGVVKFLSRVVARGGPAADVHRRLGEAYEAQKQLAKAAKHYRAYAEALHADGKRREAFDAYRRVCALLPTDLSATDRMLEIFAANPEGLESEAAEMILRGKALADSYVELRRQSRAIQVLHRVVALGHEDQDLRNRLIQAYLQTGMTGEAIAEYDALAETAIAVRDYDQAERIYRKILTIDRGRDDAKAKLRQVLSRRKLRRKGLRSAAIAGVVLSVVGWSAFLGWEWWNEIRSTREAADSAFGARLAELSARHLPLHAALDAVEKRLAVSYGDADALRAVLADGADERRAIAEKATRAARDFYALGEEHPKSRDLESARAAAQALELRVTAIAEQEARVRTALEQRVELLWEDLDLRWTQIGTRELARDLDRLLSLAATAPQWAAGPQGRKAQELQANLRDTFQRFDAANAEVAALVLANDLPAAQARALRLLEEVRPPQDLYAEIPLYRSFDSRPRGAQIWIDDRDTGLVTPAYADVRCDRAQTVHLVLPGFEPADIPIQPLRVVVARTLGDDLGLAFDPILRKELVFRTQSATARLAAAPSVVGDRLVVPTKGRTTELFDLRGTPRGTLAVGSLAVSPGDGRTALLVGADRFVHFVAGAEPAVTGRRPIPGTTTCDPCVVEDVAVIADQDGRLTAFDLRTQSEAWRHPTTDRLQAGYAGPPIRLGADIAAVAVDGSVAVIEPLTGRVRREFVVRDGGLARFRFHTGAAAAGGLIAAVVREEVPGKRSRIVAFDAETGDVRWQRTVDGTVRWAPLVWQDVLHVVCDDGRVVGFRLGAGAPEPGPVFDVGARVTAEPVLRDGILYVGDAGGTMTALDLRGSTIERLWTFRVPAQDNRTPVAVATRPTFAGDLMFFGADDRSVYALRR